jgi:hypothetical protein
VKAVGIWLLKLFVARTTECGSRTLVHAAIGGTQKEMQGRYLNCCRVVEESDYAISEEGQKLENRLWVRCHYFAVYQHAHQVYIKE